MNRDANKGTKIAIIAILLVALFVFAAIYKRPRITSSRPRNFEEVLKKYPKGTPAKLIIRDSGENLQLRRTGNVVSLQPTEDEKRRYLFYTLRLPWADAEIGFNYYEELLGVNRISGLKTPD